MKSEAFKKVLNLKYLIETINKHEGDNEKLKYKTKLLQTENKILKDDIGTKQKLIDSLL